MRRLIAVLAGLSCLVLPMSAAESYSSIDGAHLKQYVEDLAAMSRRYRDNGHPQFWGRIIGTEADAENGRWLIEKLGRIGLSDVREQPFDLPPQWMPQSWRVSASGGGKALPLGSAQPTYRGVATPAGGLDLEAVDVGLATDADLARQDLKGKAVFFYSNDYMSRHATASNGAWKRISDKGPAAIFITLMIPGNLRFQFYPVQSPVPTFSLGLEDGLAVRELIARSSGAAARVQLQLDVKLVPDLKTATIWGTLRGTSDENVMVVAHRDGWFEGANDNGTGIATMLGIAEYFAKIPAAERRRTITFVGTTGHHDGTAESGTWLSQHPELFAKTALLINCEHTAANQLVSYNGTVRKASSTSPLMWYVGGSPTLERIVLGAYRAFGVPIYDRGERGAAGEIGRIQNLAPSMQLIDTGLYWHSDRETPDIIPADGLAATTRAYAKIIADLSAVDLKDLQRPPATAAVQAPAPWAGDLTPIAAQDWTADRAAHLLERAGFGATPDEVQRAANLTPQQAVDRLVDYEAIDNSAARPFEESGIWDPGMDPFPPSRADAVRIARERGAALGVQVMPAGSPRRLQPVVDKFFYGLRANTIETQRLSVWWANRMLVTRRPLEEKLTLFWHGHFATGDAKVRDYRMMLRQNEMLRVHASGDLRALLIGILEDPAMLVYLDNGENVKKHPNENFGRELLELFTMGVGNYTERDVREAARAFTGWTNDVLAFKFDADQHDFGEKTFIGRSGPFNGTDIIDAILAQPVTAEFVAAKLYRFFVREDPPSAVTAELGRGFRASGYQIKPLLKRIFLSKDFYAPASMATQIKSPVTLVVSTYKKLGLGELPTIPDFGRLTATLGQSLFDPPNVAGWAGGRTWITPATLLQRGNLFRELLSPPDPKSFRAPDRQMPATYARVGENLKKGMNITEATKDGTGDAESNMMADRDEDYNTRYASYRGYLMAFERTRPIPRRAAGIDLTAMVTAANAKTADEAVDCFARRFLSVPLAQADRAVLVAFLRNALGTAELRRGDTLEPALRELLYLVLSTPGYQLG